MNEEQREVAERLIVRLDTAPAPLRDPDLNDDAAALLRELLAEPVINQQMTTELAEPVQEPVAAELPAPQLLVESAQGFVEGWTRSQVRSAINLALLKRRYAAPQQPMHCPKDGGECGAGGYCRPEPVQRKPLTREQIDTVWSSLGSFTDRESDYRIIARAIERAHGITGEQK